MRHHLRFLLICMMAVLAAGCSDTNQSADSAAPQANLAFIPSADGCTVIGDRVWLDQDCDGLQDKDDIGFTEPGVEGVTVNLYSCGGDFLTSTTTDANGFYLFSNLDEYGTYRVCFVLPDGYTFAPANQGASEGLDSDAGAEGCSDCIDPVDCKPFTFIDAGLCRDEPEACATIGDRVWFDLDCDGFQDKDDAGFTEPGVPNVEVSLYQCEGALVATTTTDANGFYQFSGVDDAFDYRVCFELPDGYSFAPKDAGSNDGEDSDVGPDGCTDCFSLGDCEELRNVDAGLCREEEGGDGCTPGFWKNHYTHWAATGYSPDDIFDDVFGCEIFGDDTTLGWAITNPGIMSNLAFHGVAALLNAAHPDVEYAYDESEVKDFVCDGDKDSLEEANEAGCPLSGGNTTGGGGSSDKKNRN